MQKKFDQILEKMKGEADFRPPFLLHTSSDGDAPSVLIAVSGGMDSMCLAELFLHSASGIRFEIAHCNFRLRGEESDSDAALVSDWGHRNGVTVNMVDFDTTAFAKERGLSIEMAARELRYRWFRKLCRDRSFGAVAVAHHADDNAETLFLNLVRGTGLRGICGMSMISSVPCGEEAGEQENMPEPLLLRPLLEFTREQIEGYVRRHGIEYHEDRTNSDTKYRRNLIRHEVFPLLERLNPSFVKTVNREMKYFARANAIVEETVGGGSGSRFLSDVQNDRVADVQNDGACPALNDRIYISDLMGSPHWEYRLYCLLEKYGFNSSAVESVEELLKTSAGGGRTLSGKKFMSASHILVTTSSELIIKPLGTSGGGEDAAVVTGPGEYPVGKSIVFVDVVPRRDIGALKTPKGTLYADADLLSFPFVIRRWHDGDWLRPFGMKGRKKVSDMFTDLKYDLLRKEEALLAAAPGASDGRVFALLGERIDDSVKIAADTQNVAVIKLL